LVQFNNKSIKSYNLYEPGSKYRPGGLK
jgi:hypothetical protein